jgi:TolB-like protein
MTERSSKTRRLHGGIWILLVLLATVAVGVWIARRQPPDAAEEPTAPTLIILPLHAAGARHDEGVLADGLSVELIGHLGHVQGLRVIANATAQHARADHLDVAQLSRRIGVTHVLEGELRESGGDQIHVEARLLKAPEGRTLWSHAYDRKLADSAVLQHEIAEGVAATLHFEPPPNAAPPASIDASVLREFFEARQLLDSPQRPRGIDLLRGIAVKAPQFARAHAALARTLTSTLKGTGGGTNVELNEAMAESARALELDQDLSEAYTAQAVVACRVADWARCLELFERALALDPNDVESRIAFGYWLSALGYIDRALRETETASRTDPLGYNVTFARARLLDTVGRHNEAARFLDTLNAESGGLIYAKWHNAVWRHDYAAAAVLVATMPRSDGFRESYTVVTEALSEPRLWPQALPLISTSERASGGINVQRVMMPNPDYGIVITGLEKMLRDGWPSYYMLLWMPEYAAMRRDPAFQDFLKRTRLLDYWHAHGFPPQCHAAGDGAECN